MPVYQSIYSGPPKSYGASKTVKDYIVIHNTANDAPAKNEASYAKRRTDSVSSHYYVDDDVIIQSLNTDYRAFHVGSSRGNSAGIAYEITGTNAKSPSWWHSNVAWDLLAKQIRIDCAEHGITVQTLTIDEIRAGKRSGIITHDQARRAWGGTDHTDPGPNFPMGHLIALVKGEPAPSKPTTPKPSKPSAKPAPKPHYDFPLPGSFYFGPKGGPDASVSGFYGRSFKGVRDRDWIKRYGSQLGKRRWNLARHLPSGNDGLFGSEYKALTKAFQKDQGLKITGRLDKATWRAAFENPVR